MGAYSGKISGFGVSGGVAHADTAEYIDLVNVLSGAGITSVYSSGNTSNTSGALTISSGGKLEASIQFVGTCTSGNFHISSGISGSVEITDPLVIGGCNATLGYSGDGVGNGGALTGNVALLGIISPAASSLPPAAPAAHPRAQRRNSRRC